MSKVAIEGNASGTGTLTIAAPNTNSNFTLTIPDNTGTIITSGSTTGIDASALSTGTLAAARLPTGSVLQVVQSTFSTETTVSSTSYTDSGLSASITPTSASSKILIMLAQQLQVIRATNNTIRGDVVIVRGSTQILEQTGAIGIRAGTSAESDIVSFSLYGGVFLDSPATTSSTTYKTQIKASTTANSGRIEAQGGGTNSTITLMEIAA